AHPGQAAPPSLPAAPSQPPYPPMADADYRAYRARWLDNPEAEDSAVKQKFYELVSQPASKRAGLLTGWRPGSAAALLRAAYEVNPTEGIPQGQGLRIAAAAVGTTPEVLERARAAGVGVGDVVRGAESEAAARAYQKQFGGSVGDLSGLVDRYAA